MYEFPEAPAPFSLPYPGERLDWAIVDVIGWSKGYFAARMDMDRGTVGQMCRGHRHIPQTLAIWVETLVQMHLALPRPIGWQDKRPYVEGPSESTTS